MRIKRQKLEPYEAQPFSWEEPKSPHFLIVEMDNPLGDNDKVRDDDKIYEFNIDKIMPHRV